MPEQKPPPAPARRETFQQKARRLVAELTRRGKELADADQARRGEGRR